MKVSLEIKKLLHGKCTEYIDHRIDSIQKKLDDVVESRSNETKSSAGDKHETGRTMMQLEEQKATVQLFAALEVKQKLNLINCNELQSEIALGSLVECNTGSYYISISAGKLVLEDSLYYAISMDSPIGKSLAYKRIGDLINFNDREIKVLSIC